MEDEKVIAQFGNRLRTRVCGLCVQDEKILMIKHAGLGKTHLWSPPGGGVHYAESIEAALKREFLEETNLHIAITSFLFTHEFLAPPLHAIELFFLVSIEQGELAVGKDPEMKEEQIIKEVSFQSFESLKADQAENLHPAFRPVHSLNQLLNQRGFYSFKG